MGNKASQGAPRNSRVIWDRKGCNVTRFGKNNMAASLPGHLPAQLFKRFHDLSRP